MTGSPALAEALRGHVENVVEFDRIDSTHKAAQRLIAQMDEEGLDLVPTVIVARQQSDGVGRLERNWSNCRSGLYFNWLRSGLDKQTVAQLPMLAAACLHGALGDVGVSHSGIKWPNDLLVRGDKIAGILVHARHGDTTWVTIGIGVNLDGAPTVEGPRPATTIADHLVSVPDGVDQSILTGFLRRLDAALSDPMPTLDEWRSALMHQPGDEISVRLASGNVVTGRLAEVGRDGFLRLDTQEGETTITGGDIVE